MVRGRVCSRARRRRRDVLRALVWLRRSSERNILCRIEGANIEIVFNARHSKTGILSVETLKQYGALVLAASTTNRFRSVTK